MTVCQCYRIIHEVQLAAINEGIATVVEQLEVQLTDINDSMATVIEQYTSTSLPTNEDVHCYRVIHEVQLTDIITVCLLL